MAEIEHIEHSIGASVYNVTTRLFAIVLQILDIQKVEEETGITEDEIEVFIDV